MTAAMRVTILAVEDDPIVRADLRLILEDADFVVSEARDGVEAVERAREDRPDLILLDLGLPKLDGMSAAERILRHRAVPIIALTGHGGSDVRAQAIAAGASEVVLKPFGADHLVATLRGALDASGARWELSIAGEGEDRLRAMVESMVARGHSQREIERTLRRVYREDRRFG
jgi:CheY-like chemotaxis protein